MTGRELLRLCRDDRREILILREKLDEIRASLLPKAMSIKPDIVQSSGEADPMADRLSEVVDIEAQIRALIDTMMAHEAQAMRVINAIPDRRYRCLLLTYYLTSHRTARGRIRLHTFETAAIAAGYSPETMRHYHKRALNAADDAAMKVYTELHN